MCEYTPNFYGQKWQFDLNFQIFTLMTDVHLLKYWLDKLQKTVLPSSILLHVGTVKALFNYFFQHYITNQWIRLFFPAVFCGLSNTRTFRYDSCASDIIPRCQAPWSVEREVDICVWTLKLPHHYVIYGHRLSLFLNSTCLLQQFHFN